MNLRDADSGKVLWQGSDDLLVESDQTFLLPHSFD